MKVLEEGSAAWRNRPDDRAGLRPATGRPVVTRPEALRATSQSVGLIQPGEGATRIEATLKYSPYSDEAIDAVDRVRDPS